MAERTEILTISVNYQDAVDKITKFQDEIVKTREEQKKFSQELEKGEITQKEYNNAMEISDAIVKDHKQSISSLRKEIQNNIKTEKEQEGSLKSLQAQLSNATKAYKELSKTERESAKGKEMEKHILSISNELKGAEANIGLFQRNVGNYQSALANAAAGGNSFAQSILQQATSADTAKGAFQALGTQVTAFGKTLLGLLANPIVATIAAIVAVVVLLTKAFQRNEENGNKLSVVISKISGVFSWLLEKLEPVASFLVDVLIKAFEDVSKALEFVMEKIAAALDFLGFESAAAGLRTMTSEIQTMSKAAGELAAKEAELVKQQRQANIIQKEYQREAEKLRQIRDDGTKSVQERIKANEQLGAVLKKQLEEELRIAQTALEVANLRLQVDGETTENLDAQAAAMERIADIQERITGKESEQLRARTALQKEGADLAKEAAAKQLAAARALEDGVLALLEESQEKQRQTIVTSYNRQIEDLKLRLKTEKNLNKKSREDINTLIKNLEDQKNKDLNKLDEEQVKKNYEIALQNINNRLAAIKSESAEALALRIDALNKERDMELMAAEKLGTDKALINAKYNKQIADEQKKANEDLVKRAISESQLRFENDLKQAELEGKQTFQLRLEAKQAEIDALQQMDGESAEMFLQRQRKLNLDLNDLQQQQAEYSAQQLEARITATSTMFGALSELSAEFAEQSEALGVFSKAMALFEIALSQGTAIAKGIAQAQSVPFPGNIAAIATTVATIMAGITSALKVVKGTTVPKSTGTESRQGQVSYFAEGGLVTGEGTGTSDSVPAMLSNGEAVMTARTVSLFGSTLSALNQLGGGVPIQTGSQGAGDMALNAMTESAIAKALANQKAPIVQVVDIQRGIRKSEVRDTNRTVS